MSQRIDTPAARRAAYDRAEEVTRTQVSIAGGDHIGHDGVRLSPLGPDREVFAMSCDTCRVREAVVVQRVVEPYATLPATKGEPT